MQLSKHAKTIQAAVGVSPTALAMVSRKQSSNFHSFQPSNLFLFHLFHAFVGVLSDSKCGRQVPPIWKEGRPSLGGKPNHDKVMQMKATNFPVFPFF
jgi:hypothetical protein